MKRTQSDHFEDFHLVHSEGLALVWAALRKKPRGLMPRDVTVLLYVVDQTNWRTGKAKITVNQISDDLAMQRPLVSHSISRLKAEELLVLVQDRREGFYYMPNPYLTSNSKAKQGFLWTHFKPWLRPAASDPLLSEDGDSPDTNLEP
jgi:DNA-binding transcriptional ArsR family regulator